MADIDLIIRRLSDQSLNAELRIELLGDKATIGESLVRIDPEQLLGLSADPDDYGAALTAMIFSGTLREAWSLARGAGQGLHLRVVIGDPTGALHALRWEMLRDPLTGAALAQREGDSLARQVLLDRADELYVAATPSRSALRALVTIAGPRDYATYGLAPVDVPAEAARALAVLGEIKADLLADDAPGSRGLATLANLTDGLRRGAQLLYLVCHGKQTGQGTTLFLVGADGNAAPIAGAALETVIKGLEPMRRPLLAVLLACEGASQEDAPLASVGPLLARAGVPAVLAMQAPISMVAAAKLTMRLLRELAHDGRIAPALAAARKELGDEWWVPALWLRGGRLWTANIEQQRRSLEQWIDRALIAHDLAYVVDAHRLAALITACPSWERVMSQDPQYDLNRLLQALHPLDSNTESWQNLCAYMDQVLPQGKIERRLMYALMRDAQALCLRDLDIAVLLRS